MGVEVRVLSGAQKWSYMIDRSSFVKTQFTLGAFGIILDEQERVLLCHRRDYDLWNLPGGGVEEGEAPWECVIREVKEETGLEVEVERLASVYNKKEKNEVVFSFICKVIGGEHQLNDEADRIEYFDTEAMPSNMSPKQVERIRDAIRHQSETVLKTQTGKSSIELINEGNL